MILDRWIKTMLGPPLIFCLHQRRHQLRPAWGAERNGMHLQSQQLGCFVPEDSEPPQGTLFMLEAKAIVLTAQISALPRLPTAADANCLKELELCGTAFEKGHHPREGAGAGWM